MENKNCAVCGQPMRLIPQGVSKTTGKPYSAFWACPDKHQQPRASYSSQVITQKTAESNEDAKWKKINAEKNENIKWLNALNNSCLLASTGKIELTAIKATAEKIYGMYPIGTPENKVAPVELPVKEDIADFGDMEEAIDVIPF